jgi:hypothetical protein
MNAEHLALANESFDAVVDTPSLSTFPNPS